MSDLAIAYVVDSKARMATQKYAKVRAGQAIGSQLGVCFLTISSSIQASFALNMVQICLPDRSRTRATVGGSSQLEAALF